jgi:Ca-activated chloride channel family protein
MNILKSTTMATKISSMLVLAVALTSFTLSCKNETNNYSINLPGGLELGTTNLGFPAGVKIDTTGLLKKYDASSLMTFTSGLDNQYYLTDKEDSKAYLYLEAKAGKYVPEGKKRTPLNISVVIDHSGSMEGDKLLYAKKAAKFVVDKLSSDDYLSIVMYDSKVDVVVASGSVKDKAAMKSKIDAINDNSGTNLGGGLLEGYKQVKSTFKSGYVNRVLLMSDGLANEGIVSIEALQKIAKENCQEYSTSLSTFGIGLDFNENLMKGIAEFGCGNYYFIDDPEHIPTIFEKELNGLLNLVASDVKLSVRVPKGLQLEKAFGYKYDQVGDVVTVDFRDVFSEEIKAVLLKFTVLAGTNTNQTFISELVYKNAMSSNKDAKSFKLENVLNVTTDTIAYAKAVCEKVMEQVILFESNEALEQAMIETDNGNYEKARTITNNNAGYLMKNKDYVSRSEELQIQNATNDSYKAKIANIESVGEQEKKSIQKGSKSANYQSAKKKH